MEAPESNRIGYAWLAERFAVVTLPYWRESRALAKGVRRLVEKDGRQIEYFPAARDLGEDVFAHLEFALKREGLHLELLRKVLPKLDAGEVTTHVRSKPTGRYARMIWWLYEEFTRTRLALADLEMGGYVDLLDEEIYVAGPVRKVRRQRINENLLGSLEFSPMVRRKGLGDWNEEALRARCSEIAADFPPEAFQRAVRYLYAKESKSSHEIERETPDHKRAEMFIGLLEQAWHRSFLEKVALVELQRAIVDPRYANDGWRREQVYVGETVGPGLERVHFAAPKPENLGELMEGFIAMARQITSTSEIRGRTLVFVEGVSTLVAGSVVSFVFNFLHPFSDGNGRIHRFLLHHVLAERSFGPHGIILPVSAVILNRPREYDQALESFSKPLMQLVEYTLDERQRMTVTNDTVDFYRYIDCTELTRITVDFIRETIETELPAELQYLASYDEIRRKMRDIVELPDRIADLFVKLCRQNHGTLSKGKRKLEEFARLTDGEIQALENVVREGLGLQGDTDALGDELRN
jgi:hypothetical protein